LTVLPPTMLRELALATSGMTSIADVISSFLNMLFSLYFDR